MIQIWGEIEGRAYKIAASVYKMIAKWLAISGKMAACNKLKDWFSATCEFHWEKFQILR